MKVRLELVIDIDTADLFALMKRLESSNYGGLSGAKFGDGQQDVDANSALQKVLSSLSDNIMPKRRY